MAYERIKYINGKPYIYSQESYRDKDGRVHTRHVSYSGRAIQAEDVERIQAKNDISKAIKEEKYASIKYKAIAKKHPEAKKKIIEISKEEKQHKKELEKIKAEEHQQRILEGKTGYRTQAEQKYLLKHPKENPEFSQLSDGEETEKRELELYIDNDAELYRQRTEPIEKNLARKKAQGKYDSAKAPKAYSYLIDDGAKKYAKEHGNGREWHIVFSKKVRDSLAEEKAREFEENYSRGEYEHLKPKKSDEIIIGKRKQSMIDKEAYLREYEKSPHYKEEVKEMQQNAKEQKIYEHKISQIKNSNLVFSNDKSGKDKISRKTAKRYANEGIPFYAHESKKYQEIQGFETEKEKERIMNKQLPDKNTKIEMGDYKTEPSGYITDIRDKNDNRKHIVNVDNKKYELKKYRNGKYVYENAEQHALHYTDLIPKNISHKEFLAQNRKSTNYKDLRTASELKHTRISKKNFDKSMRRDLKEHDRAYNRQLYNDEKDRMLRDGRITEKQAQEWVYPKTDKYMTGIFQIKEDRICVSKGREKNIYIPYEKKSFSKDDQKHFHSGGKHFDITTEKGLHDAEEYKNKMQEKYHKVNIVKSGFDRVYISGEPKKSDEKKHKSKPMNKRQMKSFMIKEGFTPEEATYYLKHHATEKTYKKGYSTADRNHLQYKLMNEATEGKLTDNEKKRLDYYIKEDNTKTFRKGTRFKHLRYYESNPKK